MNRKKFKAGPGKQWVEGKHFRLAQEIKYIQRRAAEHDGRFVTIGQVVFFSTETGDAWMLDPSDRLAARLARDGDPEPIEIKETETNFTIGWNLLCGIPMLMPSFFYENHIDHHNSHRYGTKRDGEYLPLGAG